ncbi:hypothetical protein FHS97_002578 [Sphingomonas endophytica]|uniref:Beta-lactamase-related domain-containing protein n=1 Tax=Sphingomonas endophytica TaxID=869719 RepID=A0ABR6N761_9SPHN|nr:ferritin-like domain-containing protein [Sphingomonas endophytica]MBB5726635.1 hypothetical protein [Sphingomonas endophytica]
MRNDNGAGAKVTGAHVPQVPRRHLLAGGLVGAAVLSVVANTAVAQTQGAGSLSSEAANNLNFALNLEYLLNQYYRMGVLGIKSLEAARTSGTGTPGLPTGGRQVKFATGSTIKPIVTEIIYQQGGHIDMLRAILKTNIVSQPAMNLAGDETGAFTQFARYAEIVGATETFDPYASDLNFLVGGYIIGEEMHRVLRSILPGISDAMLLEPLTGLFGTHSYYSGILREALLRSAQTTPAVLEWVDKIAAAFNTLSGQTIATGIRATSVNGVTVASHASLDASGSAAARSPAQALNIFYIKRGAATSGGFFPAGVNGAIKNSAA